MPKHAIDLNNFSNAAAESLHFYGSYMQETRHSDRTYYWAKLANWYLEQMGFPGRPDRPPTQAEMNGLRKIPLLRREARKWLLAEIAKGRRPTDRSLMRDTTAKFVTAIKRDAELSAAISFMKDQLGTDTVDVAPITPSFSELYQFSQGIENRPELARCQSFHELYKYAEAYHAREAGRTAPLAGGEYDAVRASDMLNYLDEYDSPDLPLDAPAVRDNVYGPAPTLDSIYGPAPQMDGI